MKDKYTSSGVV